MGRLSDLLHRLLGRRAATRASREPVADEHDGVETADLQTSHDEVAAYWTDERIRRARPREQRLDPPGGAPPGGSAG